jgi:hypothetical protein
MQTASHGVFDISRFLFFGLYFLCGQMTTHWILRSNAARPLGAVRRMGHERECVDFGILGFWEGGLYLSSLPPEGGGAYL